MRSKEIQAKYPRGTGPACVVGNQARTTSIAYDIKPIAVGDKDLPELMAAFAERFEKAIPGLAWKAEFAEVEASLRSSVESIMLQKSRD